MFPKNFLQHLFVSLAVLTSMGTLVHDTRVSRAYAAVTPIETMGTNVASNLESLNEAAGHNHIERPMLDQAASATPRAQARDDHRKYLLARTQGKNTDFTGGSTLLWPSV
jgi:hypothetical protein